jgi:hypothetical protein
MILRNVTLLERPSGVSTYITLPPSKLRLRFKTADPTGSTRDLTTAVQAVTDRYSYLADGTPIATMGATNNPLQFLALSGFERTSQLDAYWWNSTLWLPNLGRFAQLSFGSRLSWPAAAQIPPPPKLPKRFDWKDVPSTSCAGTDCDPTIGINTQVNPNASRSCDHPCKWFIVDEHETAHRTNMASCCNNYKAAYSQMTRQDIRNALAIPWLKWKAVNSESLELRASAASCEAVKTLMRVFCGGVDPSIAGGAAPRNGGTSLGLGYSDPMNEVSSRYTFVGGGFCCCVAYSSKYHCEGNDPDAPLTPCPFTATGDPDEAVIEELNRLYKLLKIQQQ